MSDDLLRYWKKIGLDLFQGTTEGTEENSRGLLTKYKKNRPPMKLLSRVRVTLDRVLDWILDVLTTLTQNSKLHLTVAPPLIPTLNNH
jgi:hypothetical protein